MKTIRPEILLTTTLPDIFKTEYLSTQTPFSFYIFFKCSFSFCFSFLLFIYPFPSPASASSCFCPCSSFFGGALAQLLANEYGENPWSHATFGRNCGGDRALPMKTPPRRWGNCRPALGIAFSLGGCWAAMQTWAVAENC